MANFARRLFVGVSALTLLLLLLPPARAEPGQGGGTEDDQAADPAPEDVVDAREPGTLRIITYNVLVAFGNYKVGNPYHPGEERKERITSWLASQAPDIVAFQEMNGYTPERLAQEAQAWGHEYAVLLKASGYPTAITSDQPIEVLDRLVEGLHHGVMRCRVGKIDYVVVHLWPFKDERRRMHEIDAALALAEDSREQGRPVVILGDFNAISPDDAPFFSETAYREYERWKWEYTDDNRTPLTDVIQRVYDAGYTDPTAAAWPEDMVIDEPRVDFIFLGPQLAVCAVGSRWVYSLEMIKRSDHPPVVTDLALPADLLGEGAAE